MILELLTTSKLALAVVGSLGLGGLGLFAWKQVKDFFERRRERKQSADAIKTAQNVAQEFANTPAGDDDFHSRMRDRIERKGD